MKLKKIRVTDLFLKIRGKCDVPLLFLHKLSPLMQYEISISMKYLIQTKKSLLKVSNLPSINRTRSFWKQSFN
jgi:hypothetical protein